MRWSYKTVHYDYKKEGLLGGEFLDEAEMEESMNEYGRAGWELVSLLEVQEGLIATFKQPIDIPAPRERGFTKGDSEVSPSSAPRFLRPGRSSKEPVAGDDTGDEIGQGQEARIKTIPPQSPDVKRTKQESSGKRSSGDDNGDVGSIRIE